MRRAYWVESELSPYCCVLGTIMQSYLPPPVTLMQKLVSNQFDQACFQKIAHTLSFTNK